MITAKALRKLALFDSLPEETLVRLASQAADLRLEAGEWLAREGEKVSFFVILRGALEMTKEVNGREVIVSEYGQGQFVGEVNTLFGIPALSSLRAKKSCRIAGIGQQDLQELIQGDTRCGKIIFQNIQTNLAEAPKHAMALAPVRIRITGERNDPSLQQPLAFLKANRISYEFVRGKASFSDTAARATISIDGRAAESPWTPRSIAEAYNLHTRPFREKYDVVIVGGGPAGLAAAVYGASEGLNILLIEQWAMGGQAGTSSRIENYLGFPSGVSGEELTERAVRQAKRFGAELLLTRRVDSLERNQDRSYRITLDGGEAVCSKTVLLATGVRWRELDVKGVSELSNKGIIYGTSSVEPVHYSGKRLFIVGGGNSAGQAAMALAQYARSVTLLVRGTSLATSMSQYLIEQLQGQPNIRIETKTSVLSVSGNKKLRAVCTHSQGNAPLQRQANALFVMIGADAETNWLPSILERNAEGFLCTGRNLTMNSWLEKRAPFLLETTLPGVFCAGDVRDGSIKRVSSAVGEGSMAIAFIHQFLSQEQEVKQVPLTLRES